MNVWMTEQWNDDYLYWDPQEYSGITEIRLPTDVVWRPDTYLYNK